MEVIRSSLIASVALVASCAAPAYASECMPAGEAMAALEENGYAVTFGDTSKEWAFFMAEDGKGGWVVFAVNNGALCPVVAGSTGIHAPLKPNM